MEAGRVMESVRSLDVQLRKAVTAVVFLFLGLCFSEAQQPATADAPMPAVSGNFFQRLGEAYHDDWFPAPAAGSAPIAERRGYAAPLDSTPFPSPDYSVGGTPVIGAPDTQTYPLMQAINENRSRTKIYGWFNGGFNVSTSNKGDGANAPAAYYVNPNRVIPDQQVLYIERLPNTVQTDHVDWGFRFAQLYGQDYRYTTAKGYFSQQLLLENHEYGYDPVMFYLDIYVPHVAKGMNIRVGRYISLPDIEAQLAPNNYTYSHSILYTLDPYTQTGIVASIKLSDHWLLQTGFSGGNDVAPWTKDVKPTGTACVDYTWSHGGDALYTCANSFNDGKYAYNNLQSYYETWYHKLNSSWHTDSETWYMYERDVPNIAGNVANPIKPETGANGAFCAYGEKTCFAPEVGVVNYVEHEFNTHRYLSIRNEFVDDIRGQRTGYATKYSEHLISFGQWIGSTVLFRPEVRLEHSYDLAAYNLGTKKTQFVVAGDITYHF
ncbi:outer membrane beta-barrel protein [Granulicella sp. 5B5]|nr:outer membrane beta-barrel protein [Granulicella sp. 5B5]